MATPTRCTNGKTRFPTREHAQRTLAWILAHPENWRTYVPERVQNESCTRCGGYHLTSNDNKPPAAGKRTRARRQPKRHGKNRR